MGTYHRISYANGMMSINSITEDPIPQRLSALRMFISVFAVIQAIAAGVVVFSIFKMNMALVRQPLVPMIFLGVATCALLVAAVFLERILLFVRQLKRDEPDHFARFSSEVLIRTFVLNVPTMILLIGFTLTASQMLLVPAAVGILTIGFTRPTRGWYDRWKVETATIIRP